VTKVLKFGWGTRRSGIILTTGEGTRGYPYRNISTVRSYPYEKLTWRLFSTSGIWLTGIFTVGSCGGFP
jgi:hypothetical protein